MISFVLIIVTIKRMTCKYYIMYTVNEIFVAK